MILMTVQQKSGPEGWFKENNVTGDGSYCIKKNGGGSPKPHDCAHFSKEAGCGQFFSHHHRCLNFLFIANNEELPLKLRVS